MKYKPSGNKQGDGDDAAAYQEDEDVNMEMNGVERCFKLLGFAD